MSRSHSCYFHHPCCFDSNLQFLKTAKYLLHLSDKRLKRFPVPLGNIQHIHRVFRRPSGLFHQVFNYGCRVSSAPLAYILLCCHYHILQIIFYNFRFLWQSYFMKHITFHAHISFRQALVSMRTIQLCQRQVPCYTDHRILHNGSVRLE